MMKNMTFIEWGILASIGFIVVTILTGVAGSQQPTNFSIGINGLTETRCIGGFKFVVGDGGNARQMVDQDGKGIPCGKEIK